MVFAVGHIGFMPYLISPAVLIIKGLFLPKRLTPEIKNIQFASCIFVFFVVVQSIVAKSFFEGDVFVYAESGMETSILKGRVPLKFSMKIIIQWLYLALNMGGLVSLLKHKHYLKPKFASFVSKNAALFICIIGLWKYVTDNFGGWFPTSFFINNISYDAGNTLQSIDGKFRFTALFHEASVCGIFLACSLWIVYLMQEKQKKLLLILIICLLLTVSSSGFFAVAFGLFLYLVKSRQLKTLFGCAIMSVLVFYIIQMLGIGDTVYDMTFNKMQSGSAEVRTTIMRSNLDLFFDTYGWGGGIGSTCAAGLATTLISQTGWIGTILFVFWLWTIYKQLKKEQTLIMMLPITVLLFAMCTSVGYLSYPTMWYVFIIALTMPKDYLRRKI